MATIGLPIACIELIRSGLKVESYQLYDQDEVQGINSDADFARAEFILQKRLYRPRRQEEQNLIAFGTGGWRALIGEGFTLHNVRRLSQALANEITRQSVEKRGVIIGYDRRFLVEAGSGGVGRGVRRQRYSGDSADRRCSDSADYLCHRDQRLGVRTGVHCQPQSSGVERVEGVSRRRVVAAGPRNPADREGSECADPERRHQARTRPGAGSRASSRSATSPTNTWTR